MTTKPVGAAPVPLVEDDNFEAGLLDVVVEVDGVADVVVGDVPAPSFAWRVSSEVPGGMTRASWSSRRSHAIRPDAADVIAARCPCVFVATAAEDGRSA